MYYEVYMDLLFLVNFLMDYILLLIVKFILKVRVSWGRVCAGALLGSVLSCVVVALHLSIAPLKMVLFYAVVPIVMLIVTMPLRDLCSICRALLALYISGMVLGGVFEALAQYVQVGSLFFALAVASYYISSGVLKVLMRLLHFGETHCEVVLCHGSHKCHARAIIDTGNHLTDEWSGKAVSIITADMAKQLFGETMPDKIRYIPYRTIGEETKVLPVVTIDGIVLMGNRERYYENPVIGISEESSFANECDVILNPDL